MQPLNHNFQNCKHFWESAVKISRNRDLNCTKNEHVYAIICRLEVAGDGVFGGSVATVNGYVVLNFESMWKA